MTDAAALSISAILPAYEEADHLENLVLRMERALARTASAGWEVILVASEAGRDGTVELARRLAAGRTNLKVVVQSAEDRGYGRALALGIAAANEPWLLLFDADGQFDPAELERFLPFTREADAVVGFRSPRRDPWPRRLAGRLYTPVACRVAGVRVRDLDCAFKLLRAEFVKGLVLTSRTGAINAELLGGASRAGARIAELPVSHHPRRGGRARFETPLGGFPRPAEIAAILRDIVALATRTSVPREEPAGAVEGT